MTYPVGEIQKQLLVDVNRSCVVVFVLNSPLLFLSPLEEIK